MASKTGKIRIGVGGWTYAPWRGVFYPEKLTHARELGYAASKLTSIEINGTFYGSQRPESFRKWAREVPDGFVFSLKGPRFCTNRRVLAEAGDSVKRFYDSGVLDHVAQGAAIELARQQFEEPAEIGGVEFLGRHELPQDRAEPVAKLDDPLANEPGHRFARLGQHLAIGAEARGLQREDEAVGHGRGPAGDDKAALSKVPAVTLVFWLIKILATTLGETGGDTVSMTLDLGYLVGTLVFIVPLVLLVVAQIGAKRFHPLLYWATIIASTTAGTTMADFATRSLGIGYAGGTALPPVEPTPSERRAKHATVAGGVDQADER
eukprot:gene42220-57162_t